MPSAKFPLEVELKRLKIKIKKREFYAFIISSFRQFLTDNKLTYSTDDELLYHPEDAVKFVAVIQQKYNLADHIILRSLVTARKNSRKLGWNL